MALARGILIGTSLPSIFLFLLHSDHYYEQTENGSFQWLQQRSSKSRILCLAGCDRCSTKLILPKYPEEVQLSLSRLSIPPNYPSTDVFTEFKSPGRGLGLKSTCYLPRGSPILSEWAYFSTANNANLSRVQENDNRFKELSCPAPVSAKRRFDVNNFQMGKNQRGIFLRASRFNHSCRPNAYFAWNGISRRLTIHAILDIPAKTEIFLNYLPQDYLKPVAQRRQALRQNYGFNCSCVACERDAAFGVLSRERRSNMRTLNENISQNQNPDRPQHYEHEPLLRNKLLVDIKTFAFLLDFEGLRYPQLADVYAQEVLWYQIEMELVAAGAESGRYESETPVASLRMNALEAARKELDLDVGSTGHSSPEVRKTLRLIDDLQQE